MAAVILILALGAEPVPVEQLTMREGEIEVVGRYGDCIDQHVTLRGSRLVFALQSQDLAQKLLGLRVGIDRLILKGRFTDTHTVTVTAVETTETEAEVYRRRGEALQGTSEEMLALGDEALARAAEHGDKELREIGLAIERKGYLAKKQATPVNDAAAQLAWIKDMVAHTNDAQWAIQEVSEMLAREPSWQPGREFLRSLGCILSQGKWLTRDDFMKAQGMVAVDGAWRLTEDQALKEATSRLARLKRNQDLLRTRTDQAYDSDAERGALAVGMTRQEAVKAWGFPDDVRRVPQEGFTIDQWRYGERLVYLLDDTVAMIHADRTP